MPEDKKYFKFEIQKKSGGVRNICAPTGALKMIQRKLADLLYDCREEIENSQPITKGPKQRPLSFGFRRAQSIMDNARQHRHCRFVLNLDIQDFFPSFNFGRVRGFFLKDKHFALNEPIATTIAQIACFNNSLPQGSPCSPVIADMVAHILDVRLVRLAKRFNANYSRYADDLSFSTTLVSFPEALAREDSESGIWSLGDELLSVISHAGFVVNPAKTRMQLRTSRQTVTGLTVNKKVNISQDYWRSARAMCDALFQTGAYHRRDMSEDSTENDIKYKMISKTDILEGILAHINLVKRKEWIRQKEISPLAQPGMKLYAKFLFFKYFINLEKTLLVCEGKTDNIYLKYAIRNLSKFHPTLGEKTKDGFKMKINLFKYDNKVHNILEMTGGSSTIVKFIKNYKDNLKKFRYRPTKHPVIILLDNDKGLISSLREIIKKRFDIDVSLTTGAPFYHLIDNLYLIKTPEKGNEGVSCIEDCFDPTLLAFPHEGKQFNAAKEIDVTKEFGKAVFAEKVVVPQADKIDWSGFEPLLNRVNAVIADFATIEKNVIAKAA